MPECRSSTTVCCTATASSRACACSTGRCSDPETTWRAFARSARSIGLEIPLEAEELLDVICEVIARSELRDAHVRPILTRGFGAPGLDPARCERPSLFVAAYPFPPLLGSDPISVLVSSVVRKAPRSLGSHVKSLNYLDAIVAKRQASAAGMQEAIMLDAMGAVAECTAANLFAVFDGVLVTPTTRAALPGITRRTLLEIASRAGHPLGGARHLAQELYVAERCSRPDPGPGSSRSRRWTACGSRPWATRCWTALEQAYRARTRDPATSCGYAGAGGAMRAATTIVVGGGIIGAATAWELARAGMDVLLLEAGRFGAQSTGRSAAIVRCHYSNPTVVRMAIESRERLRELPGVLGCAPVYTRCGWLFLVDGENAPHALANVEMQRAEGLEVDELELDELQGYLPGSLAEGIACALFEPAAGFADPIAATNAYIEALRRAGGRALESTSVEGLALTGDRVGGVRVGGELVECDNLVLAAGPWSLRLAAGIGLTLPLEITREQDVVFETAPQETVPSAVSSQVDRVYLRPGARVRGESFLVGRGFPKHYETVDPDGYDEQVDPPFEQDVRDRLVGRLPRLEGIRQVAGRVGLYDVTPDWHPILGAVDGLDGLFLATGGSGHCFKLAPTIGELVAGAILGTSPSYAELESFALGRFAQGREFRSTYGGNRA